MEEGKVQLTVEPALNITILVVPGTTLVFQLVAVAQLVLLVLTHIVPN